MIIVAYLNNAKKQTGGRREGSSRPVRHKRLYANNHVPTPIAIIAATAMPPSWEAELGTNSDTVGFGALLSTSVLVPVPAPTAPVPVPVGNMPVPIGFVVTFLDSEFEMSDEMVTAVLKFVLMGFGLLDLDEGPGTFVSVAVGPARSRSIMLGAWSSIFFR